MPGEVRTCPRCQSRGDTPYCGYCGEAFVSSAVQELEAGTFDWAQWEKGLQPFLGGLTPQEELQLLTMDPQRNGHHGNR